jgi:anti-anti-sigma regulatory factor
VQSADADAASTSLATLEARRDAIADAWYRALAPIAYTGRSASELRAEFGALTGKIVSLLSVESLARAEAEALGVALVDLRYSKPEALALTLVVLSRELDGALVPAHKSPLHDRTDTLLAALSAGFVRRVSAMLLREQDQLHNALNVARAQLQEAVVQQQEVIRQQLADLKLLSTPLVPLTAEVALMPLIGIIDAERASQMLETLLHGINQQKLALVILDITGVPEVDAKVAGALARVSAAVRLLGARLVLTGIQPSIARTLVEQGIRLDGIATHGTLQSGIAHVLLMRPGAASVRVMASEGSLG